jgi:acetyl-CoA synthetase
MENKLIPVPEKWAKHAHINAEKYHAMYADSLSNPDAFWALQADAFVWKKRWETVKNTSFHSPVSIKWFEGAELNITENCIDRHLPHAAHRTAIIWEGDDVSESRRITYGELHKEVCKFANVLKHYGAKKGDRITIYMPMIPEAAFAMLACARIGAVHSVVFGGFSAEALRGRILDCGSEIIITADEGLRGGKKIPLKANVDEAIATLDFVHKTIVIKRTGGDVSIQHGRDVWYHEASKKVNDECPAEAMAAEDPMFILYTSGSTGKPKGLMHTCGGYMVWAGMTHKLTFDYNSPLNPPASGGTEGGDIFWCTADVGWVTGHTYIVYGPLLNCATTLMFEGVPNYPDFGRFWQVIDKHQVTIFHTAPTAIRSLMREGDAFVKRSARTSLRLLGSVGEPINPEAWLWYWRVVGDERCPIVDTWWQTETGGNMIAPFAGATPLKAGAASWPFFGVRPLLMDNENKPIEGAGEGRLCIADSWPGQARSIYGDHARFEQTYFSTFAGYYFTGDGARLDADGYWWITGRVDDVLNVSGHRLGTADVESALVGHASVTEAAVVGFPHDVKGQGIYCYVTLDATTTPSSSIETELKQWVRKQIGPIATPDIIHFTPALPKTRSGKIMRRILRKIAENDASNLGDISTLINPEIVESLRLERLKKQ